MAKRHKRFAQSNCVILTPVEEPSTRHAFLPFSLNQVLYFLFHFNHAKRNALK